MSVAQNNVLLSNIKLAIPQVGGDVAHLTASAILWATIAHEHTTPAILAA